MALLPIIIAPDARLKQKCAAVERVDDAVRQLMDDMVETVHRAPGIGLAAPQVGILKRVIVVDVATRDQEPRPYRLANPEIVWASDEKVTFEEGCLSLPEMYAEVRRSNRVRVRYIDESNERQELEASGLLATCIQHEMDHLEGILFVDHISQLKRDMILRKLVKIKRLQETDAQRASA